MTAKSTETLRAEHILAEIEAYRSELELEISYPHWDYRERRMLEKALKWFNQRFPVSVRTA